MLLWTARLWAEDGARDGCARTLARIYPAVSVRSAGGGHVAWARGQGREAEEGRPGRIFVRGTIKVRLAQSKMHATGGVSVWTGHGLRGGMFRVTPNSGHSCSRRPPPPTPSPINLRPRLSQDAVDGPDSTDG